MPVVPEIQALLDQLAANPIDMTAVSPGAMRMMYKVVASARGETIEVGAVEGRDLDGPGGPLPVRVYRPEGEGPAPVLVWYHGGGWVIGDVDTSDATARRLCAEAGVVVVSVEYRLAPEHPYPAGPEDAWAALSWVAGHAAEIGGDPERLAVGGDSAGGNLAALVALRARDEGGPVLRHQLLVYPATDLAMGHPSIRENGEGYFLTEASMLWFADHYLGADRQHGDPASPAVSPLRAEVAGVAPAQVLTAEYDPLRDEGDAYAAHLAEAGVPVDHVSHPGLIHGFFSMGSFSPDADKATAAAIDRLRTALHTEA
ncbi:MAG TPA: alpha/beta hydrolase [Acidimicrobiales bacterium]|nr:alpha/beta hydrolase [Acidimicrobiales bacterium]